MCLSHQVHRQATLSNKQELPSPGINRTRNLVLLELPLLSWNSFQLQLEVRNHPSCAQLAATPPPGRMEPRAATRVSTRPDQDSGTQAQGSQDGPQTCSSGLRTLAPDKDLGDPRVGWGKGQPSCPLDGKGTRKCHCGPHTKKAPAGQIPVFLTEATESAAGSCWFRFTASP